MVEFRTAYYTPMDRQYHEPMQVEPARATANIEEPVIPMYELGQTVPDVDPAGRFKNVIQGVQAAIRRGAGRLQLMLMTPHTHQIGPKPRSYGPEVREQLREVLKANEVMMGGVEMPTSTLTNLSGFDGQHNMMSAAKQKEHLDEVRDAIKFTADVAEGGAVDLVAFEFPRHIFNTEWNQKDPQVGKQLFQDVRDAGIHIVDQRTGEVKRWGIKQIEEIPIARDKNTGHRFEWDIEKNVFVLKDAKGNAIIGPQGEPVTKDNLEPWKWNDYVEAAEKESRTGKKITPTEFFLREQYQSNIEDLEVQEAQTIYYLNQYKDYAARSQDPAEKKRWEDLYKQQVKGIGQIRTKRAQIQETIDNTKPLENFAKDTTFQGYAEAACMARQETYNNPHAKMPVSVGPELGFPHSYGGHPEEFIDIIKNSRKRMVELMTQKEIVDPWTRQKKPNPYFEPGMTREQAAREAKKHIQGCFDTGHMGMWLEHFRPDLPWEKRVKEFNKWYMEQVEKLAKDDVVGSIQLVNSMSAGHGHLPPGQGIFPVVDAARTFKKHGFKGFMVSEGHEEENLEEGRILVETWRAFNAPFESQYGPGPAQGFRDINQGYSGRTYSPRMMFGSYTPPFGEYKPWSEIPFE